jgi:hypothetical protein
VRVYSTFLNTKQQPLTPTLSYLSPFSPTSPCPLLKGEGNRKSLFWRGKQIEFILEREITNKK